MLFKNGHPPYRKRLINKGHQILDDKRCVIIINGEKQLITFGHKYKFNGLIFSVECLFKTSMERRFYKFWIGREGKTSKVYYCNYYKVADMEKVLMIKSRYKKTVDYGGADAYLLKTFGKAGADLTIEDFNFANVIGDDQKEYIFGELLHKFSGTVGKRKIGEGHDSNVYRRTKIR